MNLQPRDGMAEEAWCLADDRRATLLLYSISGPSIRLLQALPQGAYTGLWFDPRDGQHTPAGRAGRGGGRCHNSKAYNGSVVAAVRAQVTPKLRFFRPASGRTAILDSRKP